MHADGATTGEQMTTRRDFIGGAGAFAGAVFCGCGLLQPPDAHAQPALRRREVVVSGRRVKTVDIHAHCVFPEAWRCWA